MKIAPREDFLLFGRIWYKLTRTDTVSKDYQKDQEC